MKKKLVLAFVLALAVCLLLMPSAFADDDVIIDNETPSTATDGSGPVAKAEETIDDTEKTVTVTANKVQDLIDQVDQAGDNGAANVEINETSTALTPKADENGNPNLITLTQDVTESITIASGQTVTLDLNGYTITPIADVSNRTYKYTITVEDGGNLTIYGGTVEYYIEGKSAILNYGSLTVSDLTINALKTPDTITVEPADYETAAISSTKKSGEAKAKISTSTIDGFIASCAGATTVISDSVTVTGKNCVIGGDMSIVNSDSSSVLVADAYITCFGNNSGNEINPIFSISSGTINTLYFIGITTATHTCTVNGGTLNSVKTFVEDVNPKFVLNINAGILGFNPQDTIENVTVTSAATTLVANGKYAVGDTSAKELAAAVLAAGETLTITSAAENFAIADAPDGATVENSSGVTITVNGVQVAPGASYTVPVPAVLAPVVEAAAPVVQAVVEKVNELVATAANDNSSYSIASNESFTIQLSYTDASTDEALPEIVSVSVNGVELEFTIAADGSIVLSPEVLAALGPGTHVITIKTATGTVTLTIVITE